MSHQAQRRAAEHRGPVFRRPRLRRGKGMVTLSDKLGNQLMGGGKEPLDFLGQVGRWISAGDVRVGCLGAGVKFRDCCLRPNGVRAVSGSCPPMTEGSFQDSETLQVSDLASLRVEMCSSAMKGIDHKPSTLRE